MTRTRTEHLATRVAPDELDRIDRAASRAGMTRSYWMWLILTSAATRPGFDAPAMEQVAQARAAHAEAVEGAASAKPTGECIRCGKRVLEDTLHTCSPS